MGWGGSNIGPPTTEETETIRTPSLSMTVVVSEEPIKSRSTGEA